LIDVKIEDRTEGLIDDAAIEESETTVRVLAEVRAEEALSAKAEVADAVEAEVEEGK